MRDDLDKIYEHYFEMYYAHMMDRRRSDPELTRQFLRELLESLYVAQGNNWDGRSEVKDTEYRAMIAAYEVILHNWEAEA